VTVINGDCLTVMRTMADCSVDAIVCDPPAGIAFMGKSWDHDKGGRDAWIAWLAEVMREGLRLLKPGGHALVWALPRTSHWTGMALEDAGFEVRDRISHLFGSGFPKSANVSKQMDKAAGAEREVLGEKVYGDGHIQRNGTPRNKSGRYNLTMRDGVDPNPMETAPATDLAKQWDGWGTALKPGAEDWWLCRKPLSGTVASNVAQHGTGALNIDGCRIAGAGAYTNHTRKIGTEPGWNGKHTGEVTQHSGRWPANVVLDEEAARMLDEQSGERKSCGQYTDSMARPEAPNHGQVFSNPEMGWTRAEKNKYAGDTGGASRFFYCAKSSRAEREMGLDTTGPRFKHGDTLRKIENAVEAKTAGNHHPCVKPLSLMRWLTKLVTPPNGLILDPFCGSGSTGCAAALEGFRFVGIEQDAEYCAIAEKRIAHWSKQVQPELNLSA
jgi:DNA modification methylase